MLKPSSLVLVAFAALICCVHADFVRGRILNETHGLYDLNTEDYTLKTTKGAKKTKSSSKKKTKSSSKKKTKSSKTKSKGSYNNKNNNNNDEPPMPLEDHHPLTSVSLGNIRPGGILAFQENSMLISEFAYGGVTSINILTGDIDQVIPSYSAFGAAAAALGMAHTNGAIFVAGGDSKVLHVYNVKTGEEIIACVAAPSSSSSFLVDVTIVGNYAYVTDSMVNAIMVVDVEAALDGNCAVSSIPTDLNLFQSVNGESLASGIIGYGTAGLIISRTLGGLYFLDLTTTTMYQLASPQDAPSNGGLCLDGNLLYSTETMLNSISVWKLMTNDDETNNKTVLSFLGRIASVDFDFPSSCAIYDDTIYTVNPRFDTLPFPANKEESLEYFQEVFYMIGVNRFDFD